MKKSLFMFATAALVLTACSNDSDVAVNDVSQQAPANAVLFDTYASSATRAGDAGIQTTSTLQASDKGFGVFAQHSDNAGYAAATGSNFMFNEHVTYSSSAWTYSPLKYWPNETELDSQTPNATSTGSDKLSFFAYAPYVAPSATKAEADKGYLDGVTYSADPAIDNANTDEVGIQAVIANNGNVDPWVRYAVATNPAQSVDLLWGVAPSGGLQYQSVNPTDNSTYNINIAEGMPLKDLVKPAKDQKIKFLFKHALARLGLTVVAAIDQISAGGNLDSQTKIAVQSVNITDVTDTKQLKTNGTLNLNNTSAGTALWINKSGDINFTVNESNGLNPNIAYKGSASDTWTAFEGGTWTGVTNAELPVIADSKYFMVIPGHANTDLQVVITYYVITKDEKLASGYSLVENVITKKVTVSNLTNNKAYNLKLILGLTSVKLDAEVADWQVDGSTEVYLPQNKE